MEVPFEEIDFEVGVASGAGLSTFLRSMMTRLRKTVSLQEEFWVNIGLGWYESRGHLTSHQGGVGEGSMEARPVVIVVVVSREMCSTNDFVTCQATKVCLCVAGTILKE